MPHAIADSDDDGEDDLFEPQQNETHDDPPAIGMSSGQDGTNEAKSTGSTGTLRASNEYALRYTV